MNGRYPRLQAAIIIACVELSPRGGADNVVELVSRKLLESFSSTTLTKVEHEIFDWSHEDVCQALGFGAGGVEPAFPSYECEQVFEKMADWANVEGL